MTTGYFNVYKSFLAQFKSTPSELESSANEHQASVLPKKMKDNILNGVCKGTQILNGIHKPSTSSCSLQSNSSLKNSVLENGKHAAMILESGKNDEGNSLLTQRIKVGIANTSASCPDLHPASKEIIDKNGTVYFETREDGIPVLDSSAIASCSATLHNKESQQSEEAFFIPLTSENGLVPQCDRMSQTSLFAHNATRANPSLKRKYRSRYKGPIVYGRRKRRKCRFVNKHIDKPKVIVEKSPAVGICYSDITAFKDSDCESETENTSDNEVKGYLAPPFNSYGITIKTEPVESSDEDNHFEQVDDAVHTSASPSHESHHSSNETLVCEASQGYAAELELEQPMKKDSVAEAKKLYVAEQQDCPSDCYLEIGEQIEEVADSPSGVDVVLKTVEVVISSDGTEIMSPESSEEDGSANLIPLEAAPELEYAEARMANHQSRSSPKKKAFKPPLSPRKLRKSHQELQFEIHPGKGVKLRNIDGVAKKLVKAPLPALSALHYLIYNVPVEVADEASVLQARENILNFSGFSNHSEKSSAYTVKRVRLKHFSSTVLNAITCILFPNKTVPRKCQAETILSFLACPADEDDKDKRKRKNYTEEEMQMMMERILTGTGPVLTICLKRLSEEEIEMHITKQSKRKRSISAEKNLSLESSVDSYVPPTEKNQFPTCLKLLANKVKKQNSSSFSNGSKCTNPSVGHSEVEVPHKDPSSSGIPVLKLPVIGKGRGKSLKSFAPVAAKISAGDEETIQLLHLFLFGFSDKVERCRNSILEFSGFPESQKDVLPERRKFLEKLSPAALQSICHILNLCYNEENKSRTIDILLKELQEPSERLIKGESFESLSALFCDNPNRTPLRNFDKIRFNIECASPDNLTALHDILFVKPCENFEIHQRILDFKGFEFDINSYEYQCRKTLMCYMTYNCMKNVAELLDLQDFSSPIYKEELASCILKFLMDPKVPQNNKLSCNNSSSSKAHIVMLRNAKTSGNSSHIPSRSQCDSPDPPKLIPMNTLPGPENRSKTFHCSVPFESRVRETSNENGTTHCEKVPNDIESTISEDSSEEENATLLLSAYVGHPCNEQLKQDITEIIHSNMNRLTINGMVNNVLSRYPECDLQCRMKFIRTTARKILSQMQKDAVSPEQK